MKIGITGHTKNLGQFLFEKLSLNYQIIGFSRSNGYDIKSPLDRKKIIKNCHDCDIFINLVHNYYHQTDVLFELFKSWESQGKKLIINISSMVVDNEKWGIDRLDYIEYKNQKKALESMANILQQRSSKIIIKNYRISEINFQSDLDNLNTIINEFALS